MRRRDFLTALPAIAPVFAMVPRLAGAQINRDADLRLSYLAGWGINSNLQDAIYRAMLGYRRRPEGLFAGSKEKVDALIREIEATGKFAGE